MRVLLLGAAKVVAVAFGAWLGFVAGMVVSFYTVDHGDVGSAFAAIVYVPVGVLLCSVGAYFAANIALKRFE